MTFLNQPNSILLREHFGNVKRRLLLNVNIHTVLLKVTVWRGIFVRCNFYDFYGFFPRSLK